MNIFKILCSGDGSIKEPNLSAFLAYILNPNEDHGLSSVFLEKFLSPFLKIDSETNPLNKIFKHKYLAGNVTEEKSDEDGNYILDLSQHSKFVVEVVLEKALMNAKIDNGIDKVSEKTNEIEKQKNKNKEIVDIIIKISERATTTREDVGQLFSELNPIALILVENKIRKDNDVTQQLIKQLKNSKASLGKLLGDKWKDWENKICSVLVSVNEDENFQKNFETFQKKINKNSVHILWNNEDNSNSITGMIKKIINESNIGEISPLPHSTIDTLRALNKFILDDFSSNVDDEQAGGKTKVFKTYNSLEELLVANVDTDFCDYIIKNKPKFVNLVALIYNYNEVQVVYSKSMIAIKPAHSNKTNYIRFDYKKAIDNSGFDILIYKNKNNRFSGVINKFKLNEFRPEGDGNSVLRSSERYPIDKLIDLKEFFAEIINIQKPAINNATHLPNQI